MSSARYNLFSVVIHWVMALLILIAWSIAIVVGDMPLSPLRIVGFSWHKWLGITVLFLVIIRLLWRATHPAPKLDLKMPIWQEKVMALTHVALYLLMFAIPLVGWLMSSAKG